jgi:hypothetical protein
MEAGEHATPVNYKLFWFGEFDFPNEYFLLADQAFNHQ